MTACDGGCILVMGVTPEGQPHAATFPLADERLVRRAADSIGYEAIRISALHQGKMAHLLPLGQVFRTAKLFAPPIRPKIYALLQQLLIDAPSAKPDPQA